MKTTSLKLTLIAFTGVFFAIPVHAQLTLNQPNTTGNFTAPQSITLLPGFSTSGNFSAKIEATPKPPIAQSPSQNQNYVIENKIRVPNITTDAQIAGLSADQLQQTITYFDGVGRSLQKVHTQASPDLHDIVTPILYDPFGRIEKNYLSYAANGTGDGSYKPNALTDVINFYNPLGSTGTQLPGGVPRIETPFGKTIFEASPLNRVIEQGAPGNIWQPAVARTSGANATGRTVLSEFATNTDQNGIRKVKLYTADPTAANNHLRNLVDAGWYAPSQLYVSITKDENWVTTDGQNGTTEQYTDKDGHVILKRSFNGTETLSTYYVYDDMGNLSFVIPAMAEPDNGNIDQNKLTEYCYQYFYDGRKRLIEKKIPGKGWEYLVYNKMDQPVMTQDGRQRAVSPQQWTIMKYDGLARTVLTGLYEHPGSSAGTNIRQSMQDNVNGAASQWETRITSGNGYSNATWPLSWGTTLSINYYDNYNIPGIPSLYLYPAGSTMIHSLLTATRTKILDGSTGTDNMLWTVNHYDDKGRINKLFKQHFKNAVLADNNYDEILNSYDFIDQMLYSTRKHVVSGIQALLVTDEYVYDHAGRKTESWQSINGLNRTLLSKNVYNAVGQLMELDLHSTDGNSFAQKVGYKYNERGWMISSEAPLFAMELQYANGSSPQYNGNIAGQLWGVSSNLNKNYVYSYDRLNRLNNGISNENFDESLSYDKAGNILSLQRKRTGNEVVDQLVYAYNNSNRLNSVTDMSGNTVMPFQLPGAANYGYDENGNMTSRTNSVNASRNISLSYNQLNLPNQVSGTQSINYTYDASGEKLRTISGGVQIDYVGAINYTNNELTYIKNEVGRAVKNGNSFNYEYTINDHLGNARVRFDIYNGIARKIQENDYYPFGLYINRYASGTANKYLYNGKELQDGLDVYDYGARFYDPIIGRFNTIDRYSEKYYSFSPYQYAANNPALNVDVNGDSIRVNYTMSVNLTAIGLGNLNISSSVYFQGGTAYNPDGSVYSGKDPLISDVSAALTTLSSKSAGKSLVDYLETSTNNTTIYNRATNSADGTKGDYVFWNPKSTNGGPDQTGSTTPQRPSYVGLGHELAHVQDVWKGSVDHTTWYPSSSTNNVPNAEKYSTHWENRIRAEHGLSLRTHYSPDQNGNPYEPSRIIASGTNMSIFYFQRHPTVYIAPYTYK